MEYIMPGLIAFVTAVTTSIITSVITARISLIRDIKKTIYDKREGLYIKLLDDLQYMKEHPYTIFNKSENISSLNDIRSKLNLYASKDVVDIINPFYDRIETIYSDYKSMFDGEYENMVQMQYESDGYDQSKEELTQHIYEHIRREEDRYMGANMVSVVDIADVIDKTIKLIRAELKTE